MKYMYDFLSTIDIIVPQQLPSPRHNCPSTKKYCTKSKTALKVTHYNCLCPQQQIIKSKRTEPFPSNIMIVPTTKYSY